MEEIEPRKVWLSVLARADRSAIEDVLGDRSLPEVEMIRPAEIGLVMVRGRAGGNGQRFNLGEMPVTRCSVRSEEGFVGHGYVQGRDKVHAELAARLDAALQNPAQQAALEEAVIAPLGEKLSAEKDAIRAKAAATRVDFFTMVRGENE